MASRGKLGEVLLRAGVIDSSQLESALGQQRRWGGRLGIALIKLGFVSERDLVRALAAQLDLPVAKLEGKRIPQSVLSRVSRAYAEEHTCLPLFIKEVGGIETLYLGMDDPLDLVVIDDLSFRTGLEVRPVLVAPSELCEGIDRFYREEVAKHAAHEPGPVDVGLPPSRDTSPFEERQSPGAPPEGLHDRRRSEPPPVTAERLEVASVAPAAAPTASVLEPGADPGDASPRVVLRALVELLIRKGLIEREELFESVRAIQQAEESS